MAIKDIVHYTIDNIDKINADFNIILGERSNGKSYALKHEKAVKKYLKTGKRFILMRRLREEITNEKIEQYFQDVDVKSLTDGKFNCIALYRKVLYLANYNFEDGKITRHDKIGYVVALSTEQNYAGASYLDVEDIIFEEFISRGSYLANEPSKLMNFYCTVDRKRGTTKLWLVGNSISRICPYFEEWDIMTTIMHQKQGTIETKTIASSEDDNVVIAIEYCKNTGVSSHTIGAHANMLNTGSWQTDPQPHLPKSRKKYKSLYSFYFVYNSFCFTCEYLKDIEDTKFNCWFIYPSKYEKMKDKKLVFSDKINISRWWQRDIYNLTFKNDKLSELFRLSFRESNIFYASDLCGTDFKQAIDFNIRK